MVKPISIAYAIFLISLCQQIYAMTIVDLVGLASSVVGLEEFIRVLVKTDDDSGDIVVRKIEDQNVVLNKYFTKMTSYLTRYPELQNFINKKEKLIEHFQTLEDCYDEAINVQNDFNRGKSLTDNAYDSINYSLIPCKRNFNSIYNILMQDSPTISFMSNFTTALQEFETVCETGTSNQHILENMFEKVKIATAHFFIIESIRNEILYVNKDDEYLQQNAQKIENAKEDLIDNIREKYRKMAIKFRTVMSLASREIWKCDTPKYKDVIRYKNNPDSAYYEIAAFQKYMGSSSYLAPKKYRPEQGCRDDWIREKPKESRYCEAWDEWCHTRSCDGELVGCHDQKNLWFCLNENGSQARYSHASNVTKADDFNCDKRKKHTSARYICDCICHEKKFYVNIAPNKADPNKVVSGARFVVENNILYLQIEQGNLLPNGHINATEWKPLPKSNGDPAQDPHMLEIKWSLNPGNNGVRGFDLTEVQVIKHHVITGLSFRKSTGNRIGFEVNSERINLRAGTITNFGYKYQSPVGKKEITIHDCDVPTKGPENNDVISNTDNYIYLWLTSEMKDAGQSVIPFIDGQTIAPENRVPLSGVSFIHRGQKGYGGFLGMKFYTFDFTSYIQEDIGIEKPMVFLKRKNTPINS